MDVDEYNLIRMGANGCIVKGASKTRQKKTIMGDQGVFRQYITKQENSVS